MKNLKFTKTHEWIAIKDDKTCTMGITDHAQSLLGDMVYVELPQEGTNVTIGESIGVIESVKAASDIYAPISGTITHINTELESNPALLNQDPLEAGWIVNITPSNPEELNELLTDEAYQQLIKEH